MCSKKLPEETFEKYKHIIMDIKAYNNYFKMDFMGNFELAFLPFKKSYGEHPFWLIEKLEFIKSVKQKHANALKK